MSDQILLGLPLVAEAQRFVAELFLKSFILVGAGMLLVTALRRLSAAERHLILAAVLIGQLALPWVPTFGPGVPLAVPWNDVVERSGVRVASDDARFELPFLSGQPEFGADPPEQATDQPSESVEAGPLSSSSWVAFVLAVAYTVVALSLVTHFSICAARVNRRVRSLSSSQDRDVAALLDELRGELRISRRIVPKISETGYSPWAWGITNPVIVLPSDFVTWPSEHQRNALVHELSHIARNDLLTASVARLCATLFWIQPLSWLALKGMTREAENACDDRVLLTGATATTYAGQLLRLANEIYVATDRDIARPYIPAMAGSSIVGKRIRSILEARTRRGVMNKYTTTVTVVAAGALIIFLGSLTTSKSQEASTGRLTDAQLQGIAQNGPQSSDELEQLVTAYLSDEQETEAAAAFVDYIARANAVRPICEFCSSLLSVDNPSRKTDLNAALRVAFELLEERAYAARDGELLSRIASILIDSTGREAASRGTWYLVEALRVGNSEDVDDARMLAVRALVQLGRLEAARALVGEIHADPASRFYQSENMRGWMTYLDQEIGRASALSTLLMAMDEPQSLRDQDYLPMYKEKPLYPQTAAEQNKEGNVVVEFTVNDRGKTEDLRVVESSDPVFERAALEAAAQFLYMPKIASGVAINTTGVRNRITFEMGPGG